MDRIEYMLNDGSEVCLSDEEVKKLIPIDTCYCHGGNRNGTRAICPFWFKIDELPEQENGFCSFLKMTDFDINENNGKIEWKDNEGHVVSVTEPHVMPMSLIWDQCKACGINEGD